MITKPARTPHTHTQKLQANIIDKQAQKSSTKYKPTEFNNTLKGSYTNTKWVLFQGCKNGSTSTNQST